MVHALQIPRPLLIQKAVAGGLAEVRSKFERLLLSLLNCKTQVLLVKQILSTVKIREPGVLGGNCDRFVEAEMLMSFSSFDDGPAEYSE